MGRIARGDVWWADLPVPVGSGPGYRRPVLVVQGDAYNRSEIRTVVCVPLTSRIARAAMPGNVRLSARVTGLPRASVANVSLVSALDQSLLTERVGRVPARQLDLVLIGIDVVLGREQR